METSTEKGILEQGRPAPQLTRRMPIGAEPQADGGAHFRVWAPKSGKVDVLTSHSPDWNDGIQARALDAEESGYFSGFCPECHAGDYYKFRLESGEFPDPASRFQPRGPHGPRPMA